MTTGEVTIGQGAPALRRHWLNKERLRVYPLLILVIFAATWVWWTARSLPSMVDPEGKPIGYDFIAFWSAAKLALQGHPAAAFDWSAMALTHRLAVPALPADKLFLWHYPPTYLLMVLPLGWLAYPAALAAFLVVSGGLWAALVVRILPDRRAWLAAAALPAGLVNLMHGQNGFLTAALAGFALLALNRRPITAGVLIGLLAIKPHLAMLFPLALAAEGRWRTFIAAAVTASGFAALSIVAFGWVTVGAFLHDLTTVRQLVDDGNLPWGMMPSPYVFGLSLGVPRDIAMGGQVAVAVVAAVCVWFIWRSRTAPFEAKAAALMIGSMLVSPYVFYYDLTWTGLAIGWLALLGLRYGFMRGEREVLFAAWVGPVIMAPLFNVTHLQVGFPLLVLLLCIALRRGFPASAGAFERDAGGSQGTA